MLKDSEASGLDSRQALQRLMLEQLTWKGVRDHPNVQTQLLPFTEVSTEARGCTRPVTISCLPRINFASRVGVFTHILYMIKQIPRVK